jgi:hypothetical protein
LLEIVFRMWWFIIGFKLEETSDARARIRLFFFISSLIPFFVRAQRHFSREKRTVSYSQFSSKISAANRRHIVVRVIWLRAAGHPLIGNVDNPKAYSRRALVRISTTRAYIQYTRIFGRYLLRTVLIKVSSFAEVGCIMRARQL